MRTDSPDRLVSISMTATFACETRRNSKLCGAPAIRVLLCFGRRAATDWIAGLSGKTLNPRGSLDQAGSAPWTGSGSAIWAGTSQVLTVAS